MDGTSQNRLAAALKRADRLQVFPPVAAKIQEVAESPDSSISNLEEVVSLDAALSARILSLANSPLLGLTRTVGTLRHALCVLGMDMVRGIALGLAALSLDDNDEPRRRAIWWHAIRAATAARLLLKETRGQAALAGEGFITALLHDIGKLVLLQIYEAEYSAPLTRHLELRESEDQLVREERGLFGFDHAELGAATLRHWNLPRRITTVVEYHHAALPDDLPADVVALSAALELSDQIGGRLNEIPADVDRVAHLAATRASHQLDLGAGVLQRILDEIDEQASAITALTRS